MKQIIIALALMLGVSASAQSRFDNNDLSLRTKSATTVVKNFVKGSNQTEAEGYAALKIDRLKYAVQLTDDQKTKLKDLFVKQYSDIAKAASDYRTAKSDEAKKAFIKLVLKQEQDTRALFSENQLVDYLSYWNSDYSNLEYTDFRQFCMPDHIYYGYLKQLQ